MTQTRLITAFFLVIPYAAFLILGAVLFALLAALLEATLKVRREGIESVEV